MQKSINIGTRGSPLALAQAHEVKEKLLLAHDGLSHDSIEICVIQVSGDQILDRSLMAAGGKGLFTKEIEDALLSGDIDMAVHSSKDMPTTLPDGLMLSTFLEREDPRDAFISNDFATIDDIPEGATIGTSSLRRRAQLLKNRPDLSVVNFRGNVQTRLKKLKTENVAGTFLAVAGLNRLAMQNVITQALSLDNYLPAPAQGAITIEIREDDEQTRELLAPIHHEETATAVNAERALLAALDGSCKTPIAAHAELMGDVVTITAELLSVDGQISFIESATGPAAEASTLGTALGTSMRDLAGEAFFEQLIKDSEALL